MCCLSITWEDTDPTLGSLQLQARNVHFSKVTSKQKYQTCT